MFAGGTDSGFCFLQVTGTGTFWKFLCLKNWCKIEYKWICDEELRMELAFMHFQHKPFPFLLISGGKSCVKPVCCLNQNVPQRKNCWSFWNKKGTAGFPETDNSAFQGCSGLKSSSLIIECEKSTINSSGLQYLLQIACFGTLSFCFRCSWSLFRFLFYQEIFYKDFQLLYEDFEGLSRRQGYVTFRSESRFCELNNLYFNSLNNNEDSDGTCPEEKNWFPPVVRATARTYFSKDFHQR